MSEPAKESWSSGSAYELWVGRWSRSVAQHFIEWLAVSPGRMWGDDSRVHFELGDACALTWAAETCDLTVSGLMLNFVPDSEATAREMVRVMRPTFSRDLQATVG